MRILILQQFLPHYRVPIFNQLSASNNIDLTVAHGDAFQMHNPAIQFKQVLLTFRKTNKFFTAKPSVKLLAEQYDIVIVSANIRILSFLRLGWVRARPFKLILWGPGVTVGRGFDVPNGFDWLRYRYARRADAMLFYTSYPIEKYAAKGLPREKLFVAHNTVELPSRFLFDNSIVKTSFLFLGTLYRDKRLDILLHAFAMKASQLPPSVCINIVGDGPMRKEWIEMSNTLGIGGRVHFHGKIEDSVKQEPFFESAFACISPGQAGLSVLQSMAYGIPFITSRDAITGGERLNIIDGNNSIFFDGTAQALADKLVTVIENQEQTRQMAFNAFQYYQENCSIENMLSGFLKAIVYVS